MIDSRDSGTICWFATKLFFPSAIKVPFVCFSSLLATITLHPQIFFANNSPGRDANCGTEAISRWISWFNMGVETHRSGLYGATTLSAVSKQDNL